MSADREHGPEATRVEALERELERARSDLAQVTRAAAHDLLEPLAVIQGYLRFFEVRHADALVPEARELIATAMSAAQRMQGMIRDLHAWSRLRRQPLERAPVGLEETLRNALEELRAEVERTTADVRVERLPAVRADRAMLVELWRHLIENSLRFRTSERPRISISSEAVPEGIVCTVRDEGIGVPAEFCERVFGVFERLHPRDQYPGNGIGLSLARMIVEKHGGRIWFEPRERGACVRFLLPADPAPREAPAATAGRVGEPPGSPQAEGKK
jgi:light-regulated signal transduction histidine kinase (bacteriophytochrome)